MSEDIAVTLLRYKQSDGSTVRDAESIKGLEELEYKLTLDKFAGLAMQALLSDFKQHDVVIRSKQSVAVCAYGYAQQMMEVRAAL